MPNWVVSKIFIEGNQNTLTKIKNQLKTDDEVFELNQIIPMPESMNVEPGGSGDTLGQLFTYITNQYQKTIDDLSDDDKLLLKSRTWNYFARDIYSEYEDNKKIYLNSKSKEDLNLAYKYGKQKYENIKKYGAADWYDWSIANWGTKWEVSDTELSEEAESLYYRIETAWSCPLPAFEKLSEQYPDTIIKCFYADEDE